MNTRDEFIKVDSIGRVTELYKTGILYFTNSGSINPNEITRFICDDIYIGSKNVFYEKNSEYRAFSKLLGKRVIDKRSNKQGIIIEYNLTSDGYDEYLVNENWYNNGQLLKQFIIED